VGILDFFKKVPAMTTEEVRSFLRDREPEEYNLVDVRQPAEYEEGHLPGSRLIPLGKLEERIDELDPGKPTIAY
jgi:rhodanese-related sulfurtransferase